MQFQDLHSEILLLTNNENLDESLLNRLYCLSNVQKDSLEYKTPSLELIEEITKILFSLCSFCEESSTYNMKRVLEIFSHLFSFDFKNLQSESSILLNNKSFSIVCEFFDVLGLFMLIGDDETIVTILKFCMLNIFEPSMPKNRENSTERCFDIIFYCFQESILLESVIDLAGSHNNYHLRETCAKFCLFIIQKNLIDFSSESGTEIVKKICQSFLENLSQSDSTQKIFALMLNHLLLSNHDRNYKINEAICQNLLLDSSFMNLVLGANSTLYADFLSLFAYCIGICPIQQKYLTRTYLFAIKAISNSEPGQNDGFPIILAILNEILFKYPESTKKIINHEDLLVLQNKLQNIAQKCNENENYYSFNSAILINICTQMIFLKYSLEKCVSSHFSEFIFGIYDMKNENLIKFTSLSCLEIVEKLENVNNEFIVDVSDSCFAWALKLIENGFQFDFELFSIFNQIFVKRLNFLNACELDGIFTLRNYISKVFAEHLLDRNFDTSKRHQFNFIKSFLNLIKSISNFKNIVINEIFDCNEFLTDLGKIFTMQTSNLVKLDILSTVSDILIQQETSPGEFNCNINGEIICFCEKIFSEWLNSKSYLSIAHPKTIIEKIMSSQIADCVEILKFVSKSDWAAEIIGFKKHCVYFAIKESLKDIEHGESEMTYFSAKAVEKMRELVQAYENDHLNNEFNIQNLIPN